MECQIKILTVRLSEILFIRMYKKLLQGGNQLKILGNKNQFSYFLVHNVSEWSLGIFEEYWVTLREETMPTNKYTFMSELWSDI